VDNAITNVFCSRIPENRIIRSDRHELIIGEKEKGGQEGKANGFEPRACKNTKVRSTLFDAHKLSAEERKRKKRAAGISTILIPIHFNRVGRSAEKKGKKGGRGEKAG